MTDGNEEPTFAVLQPVPLGLPHSSTDPLGYPYGPEPDLFEFWPLPLSQAALTQPVAAASHRAEKIPTTVPQTVPTQLVNLAEDARVSPPPVKTPDKEEGMAADVPAPLQVRRSSRIGTFTQQHYQPYLLSRNRRKARKGTTRTTKTSPESAAPARQTAVTEVSPIEKVVEVQTVQPQRATSTADTFEWAEEGELLKHRVRNASESDVSIDAGHNAIAVELAAESPVSSEGSNVSEAVVWSDKTIVGDTTFEEESSKEEETTETTEWQESSVLVSAPGSTTLQSTPCPSICSSDVCPDIAEPMSYSQEIAEPPSPQKLVPDCPFLCPPVIEEVATVKEHLNVQANYLLLLLNDQQKGRANMDDATMEDVRRACETIMRCLADESGGAL